MRDSGLKLEVGACTVLAPQVKETHANLRAGMKKTIALFIHHPTCSTDSVNGVIAALSPLAHVKLFTRHKVQQGFFDDVDLVVFPGGDGEATLFRSLLKPNMPDVRAYMQRGGKYLGICMGAYWADAYYFNF